jgi:hypothetical protein
MAKAILHLRRQLHAFAFRNAFSIMPPDREPPRRPRLMTVREASKADCQALRGDWNRVGSSIVLAARES